ncbi:MAG TPA: J domain-containing protein [Candidatus Poseidoniales archaeon]|nr:J domain-containing protein [Candidatus Poseidoniales archaeon]
MLRMAESDPYEVLGVKKDASDKEITRAYRRLAKRFHPDKNDDPAAEDRMKRINAAYEKIDSPEKRQKYDQESQMHNMFGRRGGNPFGGGGNPFGGGGNPFGSGGGGGSMEDMLSGLFGGGGMRGQRGGMGGQGRRQQQAQQIQKGADLNAYLDLSISQAEEGGKRPFKIRRLEKDGMGGVSSTPKTLSVNIKSGIIHGTVMRLKKMGHEHPKGEAGDLNLTIRIDPGEDRRWEGDGLVQLVEVNYSTLLLGGKVRITTPNGKSGNLNILANSRVGDRRRMKGKGYAGGDLDLEFIIAESSELSPEQISALKELQKVGL